MANKSFKHIPEAVYHPQFLKFARHYADIYIKNRGFGRWIKELQYMVDNNMFEPKKIRLYYIQLLCGTSELDFHKKQAVWYVGCNAKDATAAYIDEKINALYDIRVITGELAYDDDDDPYTDLTYEEASQIVKALNEEAEEELFVMKRKC